MQAFLIPLLSVIPAVVAYGTNYDVQVGANNQLTYWPEYVSAQPGDQVTFHFHPKNHTVTQSSFDEPCKKIDGGFASGFRPVANEGDWVEPFVVNVQDTNPVWVYCGQPGHCPKGMVFAINPPAEPSEKSFSKFKQKAIASAPPASSAPAGGSPACPPTDDAGSPLTGSSLQGDFVSCTYQQAGACTYFSAGQFSSGSSTCPDAGLPQGQGAAQTPAATGVDNSSAQPTGSGSSSGVQCPPADNNGSPVSDASVTSDGQFAQCTYQSGTICTYFFNGNFDSGSSVCPSSGIPQATPASGSGAPAATGIDNAGSGAAAPGSGAQSAQCPPTDNKGSAVTDASSDGTFVSCTYPTARLCTYFINGGFSSGSSDCPASGLPQAASGSSSLLTGAIGDDDGSPGDIHTLIRNTYIAIGLLAAVLLGVISLIFVSMSGRGCLKGRSSTKYNKVSNPKGFEP